LTAGRYATALLSRIRSGSRPEEGGAAIDPLAVEAEVHESAAGKAGFANFGDDDYRPGLRQLLGSIAASRYSARQQRVIVAGGIELLLVGRLYSERGWLQDPECLRNRIEAPLIICGLPRSGTTALHKLLSIDRRFQGLEAWLSIYPMPRPPRARWASMPEHQAVAGMFERMNAASGVYSSAHHRDADEVDECLWLLGQSFVSNQFPAAFELPDFDAWFRAQSQLPAYQRFANNLRLIGANEPTKPWLLKNPGHLTALDALLDTFPDARIVQTHRHPAAALASLVSLLAAARKTALGPSVPVDGILRREVDYWSEATRNAMRVREQRRANVADVLYGDFVTDPLRSVRAIYDAFGLDLSTATVSDMQAWIDRNPADKHGTHAYGGLPQAVSHEVQDSFGDYIERFDLA